MAVLTLSKLRIRNEISVIKNAGRARRLTPQVVVNDFLPSNVAIFETCLF